jgi:hypothetical protein
MDVEIFYYEVEDAMNGIRARFPIPATLDFIRESPHRMVIPGSGRAIDERLVDSGRALFAPDGSEAKLLKDFATSSGGMTTEPLGTNINRHELAPLIKFRLIDTEKKSDCLEMKISPLGYLALEQLVA